MSVNPPLSASRVQSLLTTTWMGKRVYVYEELASTNIQALELARTGAPHGSVILSETQRAGRGRQGRTWFSPARVNIYCSIVLKSPPHPTGLPWIPLIAGIAISTALESHVAYPIQLKWPNDLLANAKKVGGILCEVVHPNAQDWIAILGFGLNVNLEHDLFPSDLREMATSLYSATGRYFDRHLILASVLIELERFYDRLLSDDLSDLRTLYKRRCATVGQFVRANFANGKHIQGLAVDIGLDGALQIQVGPTPSRNPLGTPTYSHVAIHAGDIVHLREPSDRHARPDHHAHFIER